MLFFLNLSKCFCHVKRMLTPGTHRTHGGRVAAALPVVFYFGVRVNRLQQPHCPLVTHVSADVSS